MNPNNIIINDNVFFLVAKAANSSIKAAVKRYLGFPVKPETLHRGIKRITACQAAKLPGHKIAFVRNPWARAVSCYYQKIIGPGKSSLLENGFKKSMSFTDFVCQVCALPDATEVHIRDQVTHMFCGSEFIPEKVVKIESLNDGWAEVQAMISGLPDLNRLNTSKHPFYKDCYTVETRTMIEKRYKKDIEVFDYAF